MTHPIHALYQAPSEALGSPALIDGDVTVSHRDLHRLVDAAAADLALRTPGAARIGLCAINTWRHVVAYLATLRANRVWVPLNPRNGPALNGAFRERARLDLTLFDTASADAAGSGSEPTLDIEDWIAGLHPAGRPGPVIDDADAPFAIKFTGGSTGIPKGVVQSQASARAALDSLVGFYGFTSRDVNLAVAPLTHGASHYVLPILAAGGAHVLLPRSDRILILEELRRRATVAFMPPTLIALLMREASFTPADFPRLRSLTYSAAPMSPDQIGEAIDRFGPVLSTLYGQTEAPMAIAAQGPEAMADLALRAAVGGPFPNTPVRVLTAVGEVAEQGEGEVLVGGDLARTWYLDDPGLTAQARHEGWLRTGDIGRLDADGRLYLLGRSKEMIITGGYNVYPAEVEAALTRHPDVREACAFSLQDPIWGERLEAAVAADGAAVDDERLRAFVRDVLGPVRTPKRVHLMDALPRNPVGKVVRGEVRDLLYPQSRDQEGGRQR